MKLDADREFPELSPDELAHMIRIWQTGAESEDWPREIRAWCKMRLEQARDLHPPED